MNRILNNCPIEQVTKRKKHSQTKRDDDRCVSREKYIVIYSFGVTKLGTIQFVGHFREINLDFCIF